MARGLGTELGSGLWGEQQDVVSHIKRRALWRWGMEILRKAWHTWKRIGQAIGDLMGRVTLTVFYFTLFLPFGLGVRLWGDPLAISPKHQARWLERTTHDLSIEDAQRLS